MRPTAIDLFSGCGGLSQGLKMAGFKILAALDSDPVAAESYIANHPETTVWEHDIRAFDANDLLRWFRLRPGELDLLAGCPPCQGFSSLRTMNGAKLVNDARNDLIFDFYRFVQTLRPKAVMMENVPGLASDQRLDTFIADLKKLGYKTNHAILDAAAYGVPQRRKRLILLAGKNASIPFGKTVPDTITVRDAIGNLGAAGRTNDPLHDMTEKRDARIVNLIHQIPRDGGSRSDLSTQLPCHTRSDGFWDVYGRMSWDQVSPTITSGCVNPSKGRFLHPEEHRCITLREAAILQSFPPSYHVSLRRGKFKAAEIIGNALPPAFIRQHAISIRRHLSACQGRGDAQPTSSPC